MKTNPKSLKPITPQERHKMIETAAYFHAQMAKFQGTPEEHWQAATRQVDELIRQMNRWPSGGFPST